MRRALARFLLVCAAALLLALASIPVAYAHAALLSTTPSDGAVVDAAPRPVELHFNEPVGLLAIKLIGPDGSSEDLMDATRGGETVTVDLPETMQQGTHVLSWRVVSTDGHPIGGSLVFSIGTVTGAAPEMAATDTAVGVILWASKVMLYAALLGGIGGIAFGAVAHLPAICERISTTLVVLGLVAVPVSLAMQGLDALGLPLAGMWEGKVWTAAVSTSYGTTAALAMAAFTLALAALAIARPRVSALLALAALTVGALAIAMSGHASAASPQWLTRPAVFLHLAGIMFWVGALLPLWIILRNPSQQADLALARFSRLAPYAVAPVVVSGVTLAVIQMGAPGPQWLAPYGIILAIKLVLLAALFALAIRNRRWLTGPALAGRAKARRRLRQSIRIELMLVLAIIGLVAGWRFTPPPRALALVAASVPPIEAHLHSDRAGAVITVTPGRPGPVDLTLALSAPGGKLLDPQEISVTLAAPQLGIEPIKRAATRESDRIWRVEKLSIPIAGTWTVAVDLRLSRFELVHLEGQVVVR